MWGRGLGEWGKEGEGGQGGHYDNVGLRLGSWPIVGKGEGGEGHGAGRHGIVGVRSELEGGW